MATTIAARAAARANPLATTMFERVLAAGAVVLLAAVLAALAKGRTEWVRVPLPVWAHLVTITIALALTPTMLLRPRGTRAHRRLGWLWSGAMAATAALSFLIHDANPVGYSPIHILSAATLGMVPWILWSARTHRVRMHRSAVRGLVLGALLIAGAFTFPFDRLMGHWLFG